MTKIGTYVKCAHVFFELEEMLRKKLDRNPNDEEIACHLKMSPRMCEAIKLRFGKDGIAKVRLIDVADKMEISVERVRQLIGLGLRRIKVKNDLKG